MVASDFDDEKGGWWKADLTGTYEGAKGIRRTVVHLNPGIVAVLDEAELEQAEEISLRWHTVDRCEPDAHGSFTIEAGEVRCAGQVARLDGELLSVERKEHAFEPPYDVDYYGIKRPQLYESYVEIIADDDRATFLALFCTYGPGETAGRWSEESGVWSIGMADGQARVAVTEDSIEVKNTGTGAGWLVER
ncbi:MAG: hypothetical protein QGI83_24555, partial [Candidatus Latescibacteria bacterium]|jgi:hypothetical protein|nr:hypothetical protein [Candidatus Latescibacterota bacterium]